MPNRLVLIFLLVSISGCNTFPEKKEDQATYHLDIAVSSYKTDPIKACAQINASLSLPTGSRKVKEALQSNSVLRDDYISCLERNIENISNYNDLRNGYKLGLLDIFYTLKKDNILDYYLISKLADKIGKKLYQGNISSSLPIDLTEISDDFPSLKSGKHVKKMADRTIKNLQINDTNRAVQIDALTKYISDNLNNADELSRIEKFLPTLNLSDDEIRLFIHFFPNYSKNSNGEVASEVMLELKNADRLVFEDMRSMFESYTNKINWVDTPKKDTLIIVIDQARFIEKLLPEKVENVIYERNQVNFVNAVFDMPNHASFVYDVVTIENKIEYGYIISAYSAGVKISEEIVRGHVESNSVSCRNAKIQNVFGGVLPSGFIANEDMARRCRNDGEKTSDELKTEVYKEVLNAILRIPGINGAS
jgi:hypothetical protein